MYVVTFYSFKGGSGRSMSLINVAAELAQSGRRVLVVDFDLEAPGIGEFDLVKPADNTAGVVEFVSDYLQSGIVPDVNSYVYQSNSFESSGGQLMVMPAGRLDGTYQERFGSINWQTLYAEHDGYALLEDLRLQWQEQLQCDYVLIDSRTGYTDIGGICTRQLPDAVCLVFAPNKQNLTGLTQIVAEIKKQETIPGLRHPRLHFVASNVPNFDDDNQVLTAALDRFKDQLGYIKPCAVIQHFNSFALLNEEVFTLKYPKTRLAEQYRELTNKITQYNLRDRISVLEFLREVIADYPSAGKGYTVQDVDSLLDNILKVMGSEPDILFLISKVKRVSGDIELSRNFLESALELGCNLPRAYLDHAVFSERENDFLGAWHDVRSSLNSEASASISDLITAVRLGIRLNARLSKDELDLDDYAKSRAFKTISNGDCLFICGAVYDSKEAARLIILLLRSCFDWDSAGTDELSTARVLLGNSLIAVGDLESSLIVYETARQEDPDVKLVSAFNIGMALYWLGRQDEAASYFDEVQNLLPESTGEDTPNRLQCAAFLHWVSGNSDEAIRKLDEARAAIGPPNAARFFSCWRYYTVGSKQGESDLNEMRLLFAGTNIKPRFINP